MRPFFYRPALFAAIMLILSGCQTPRNGTGQGALSLPTDKQVRILSREISGPAGATPGTLHHKWTILGERNWTAPKVTDLAGSLQETYPLNDTQRKGGCNTWEYDLVVQRIPSNPAVLRWSVGLHGSNGMTQKSEGTTAITGGATASIDAVVQILEDRDSVRGLPADLTLARVGDKPLTLHVDL